MLKQRHQLFVSLLSCVDGLVGVLACYGAWAVRRVLIEGGFPGLDSRQDVIAWVREPLALLALPMLLLFLWAFGLYRPRRDSTIIAEGVQVIKSSICTSVGLIVILWALGPLVVGGWAGDRSIFIGDAQLDAGRIQLGTLLILLPVLLLLERGIFRLSLRFLRRRGINLRHVVIIGTGRLGRIACRTLDRNSWTGLHVTAFVHHGDHAHPNARCVERPVLGGLTDLERILEETQADAVYLALPATRAAAMPALLRRLERFVVDVRIIPDVHPRYMPQSMAISDLEGMPILTVRESPLNGYSGMVKRAFDVIGALVAMIVALPIMLLVAAVIRFTSPGPIIFKQRRVSLDGEVFNIYKFRTMHFVNQEQAAEPDGPTWTRRNDPRITRFGAWLRKTSIDELPQLFNVLLGDMSLVGPRPERPELIERFREDWRGYMLRQHVKAGITGWAQVNGLRGDTSLRKRLQHDLFYIRHWSLGFDVKILWLTLFKGFVHRNAH